MPLTRSALFHPLWSQEFTVDVCQPLRFVVDIDPKVDDMTKSAVRLGVGTRLIYDGEAAEVVELQPTKSGTDLTLRIGADSQRVVRIALRKLLDGGRARIIGDEAASDDRSDIASVILAGTQSRQ